MLTITIPASEFWDEKNEQFVPMKETRLQLEHSLVSISKWEAKWHKPFLSDADHTTEETIDYVRCMTLAKNVDPMVYLRIDQGTVTQITDYINDSMTATWFSEDQKRRKQKTVVTSELIYYWMILFGIPFECQKWHLNRLLTLIRVCSEKNTPKKKMSAKEINARNKALNAQRRKRLGTKG